MSLIRIFSPVSIIRAVVILLLALVFLASCNAPPTAVTTNSPSRTATVTTTPTATATATPTASATPTPTNTLTPTPTTTPTPTPTPTPTAQPVALSGDLRSSLLSDPVSQPGAFCGVVDILDFPMDPPDAERVAVGGGDFGVYRSRYNGHHTGEDWWRVRSGRLGSLNEPLYAIGHGQVTYAAPLGWGADQGTLVIRHKLPDGRVIYSFYGHVDPPSLTLRIGDCVARGDLVGRVGNPRSSPHLHFEIRAHMPAEPGPGYWWTDPTTAGWYSPSQFIWNYRIQASPGVLWNTPLDNDTEESLGLIDAETLLLKGSGILHGLDLATGDLSWSQAISSTVASALDTQEPLVYLARLGGQLQAWEYLSPDEREGGVDPLTMRWEVDSDTLGLSTLVPLPTGGVVLAVSNELYAFSPTGELLWEHEDVTRPFAWAAAGEELIVSPVGRLGPLWSFSANGASAGEAAITGRPVSAAGGLYLYAENGIFRLDPATLAAEQIYKLAQGAVRQGDMIALPDGSLLLIHADGDDRRLLAFTRTGELLWSVRSTMPREDRNNSCWSMAGLTCWPGIAPSFPIAHPRSRMN